MRKISKYIIVTFIALFCVTSFVACDLLGGGDKSVKSVTISGPNTVAIGTETQYTANLNPSDAKHDGIVWEIVDTNTAEATITEVGKFKANSVGSATIKVTVGGKSASKTVTVTDEPLETYTITFETNGGNALAAQSYNEGQSLELPTPVKEGFYFLGWYINSSLSTEFILAVMPAENIKLYAEWSTEYKITLNYQNATGNNDVLEQNVAVGQNFELPVPTKEDYFFCGWYSEINGGGTQYTDFEGNGLFAWSQENGITLYAFWTNAVTPGIVYKLINDDTAYEVSAGAEENGICIIPDTHESLPVTSIGSSAFFGCSGLTIIMIPSSVTSIGNSAFAYCSGLTSITIPSSVTSIGNHAFGGCSGLTSITIQEGVTSIGVFAFGDCSGLTSITIPSSVTSIEQAAFGGCSGLTSITIPSSVTSIGNHTFAYCSELTSITIPSSVTSIGDYAFKECSGLTSITIPSSVTSIGAYAFSGCIGLTSITIPSSVTSIGGGAFWDCSELTSITIPSSVTNIGSSAFADCSKLTIYAETASKPSGWSSPSRPVVWGCTLSADKNYVESFNKTSSDSILYPTATNGISAPYREGYTFGGWATSAENAESGVSAYTAAELGTSYSSIADGTTLYAIWTPIND